VPVRIRVDRAGAAALRPGLSVEVKVDLKSRGGLSFAEAATGPVVAAVR
jgi:membrane fusion protein (multidrug efflux system)